MASRASGVSAESHSDQSVASATSRRVAEPPAVPTVAPFEGFQFIQNLATQTSGRQASHESVGAWGVAALCGSAATTATLTAFVKSRSKAERDLPKGTHVRAAATAFKALGVASAFTGVAGAAARRLWSLVPRLRLCCRAVCLLCVGLCFLCLCV